MQDEGDRRDAAGHGGGDGAAVGGAVSARGGTGGGAEAGVRGGISAEDGGDVEGVSDGDLATGFLLGLLVGEGHFGGDGRQPQVTLRMHVRHQETFERLRRTYPGSKLYGPYHHGGRSYFQWSARGRYLRDHIVPLVERHRALLDAYAAARFDTMCERYRIERRPSGDTLGAQGRLDPDPAAPGG